MAEPVALERVPRKRRDALAGFGRDPATPFHIDGHPRLHRRDEREPLIAAPALEGGHDLRPRIGSCAPARRREREAARRGTLTLPASRAKRSLGLGREGGFEPLKARATVAPRDLAGHPTAAGTVKLNGARTVRHARESGEIVCAVPHLAHRTWRPAKGIR